MAKIETYVLANAPLTGSDKLIGTDTAHSNATKNFSINDLIQFITGTNTYVPYSGATGTVDLNNNDLTGVITFSSNDISNNNLVSTYDLDISNGLFLSASQGALGQVLTSQGTGSSPIWSSASTGAQGIQGPVGPQGPIGPVGPAGLTWQGIWVSGTSYVVNDAVGYNGASWFCILATSGIISPDLDTTHWALLAAQGAQGPAGATGAQGPTGATGPQGASGNNTLQQVLNNSTSLTNGRNFQGTGAGSGNLGFNVVGFGTNAMQNNSGSNVIAIGSSAGANNTFNNVVLLGANTQADDVDQIVAVNAGGFFSRISNKNITADRKYELPNASGTIPLTVNGQSADSAGDITIPSAGGSVNTIKVSLTSADILSLFSTPFILIPAQGSGTLINVLKIWYKYNFNTTPYSGGGNISANINSFLSVTNPLAGALNLTSNYVIRPVMNTSSYTLNLGSADNQPLTLNCTTNQTLGDGTLDVYITYDVITL